MFPKFCSLILARGGAIIGNFGKEQFFPLNSVSGVSARGAFARKTAKTERKATPPSKLATFATLPRRAQTLNRGMGQLGITR